MKSTIMNKTQFREEFYIERMYQKVSEIEFTCHLIVKSRENNNVVTRIETKINILDVDQEVSDSRFTLQPISWEHYLNKTIEMLFNMLMIRLNIDEPYTITGRDEISEFFNENPFYRE